MFIYIILFILLYSLLVILLVKRKNKKVSKAKQDDGQVVGDKIKRKGELSALKGMIFCFDIVNSNPKQVYTLQKGKQIAEVKNYGLFDLSVGVKRLDDISIFDISHTHIVPITVNMKCKSLSRIYMDGNGYEIKFLTGGTSGFIILGAKVVKLDNDLLQITLSKSCRVVYSEKGVPSREDITSINQLMESPFLITTPSKTINGFFNGWLWSEITSPKKKDISSGLLIAFIKNLYGDRDIREYIEYALVENREKDLAIYIHLFCDYLGSLNPRRCDDFVQKTHIRSLINAYIKQNEEDLDYTRALLKVSALNRISEYMSADDKIKILARIEISRKRYRITSEDILKASKSFFMLYFSKKNGLAKRLYDATSVEEELKEIQNENVLLTKKPCDFENACIVYYYLIKRVFGVKRIDGEYYFEPRFPKPWKRASIELSNGQKRVTVELIQNNFNAVKVDGVSYSGDIAGKVGKDKQKYTLYFK